MAFNYCLPKEKNKEKEWENKRKPQERSKHIKGGGVVHQNSLFISVTKTDFFIHINNLIWLILRKCHVDFTLTFKAVFGGNPSFDIIKNYASIKKKSWSENYVVKRIHLDWMRLCSNASIFWKKERKKKTQQTINSSPYYILPYHSTLIDRLW